MRYITVQNAEMVKTLTFFTHLGTKDKKVQILLQKKIDDDNKNPENFFNLGFFHYMSLTKNYKSLIISDDIDILNSILTCLDTAIDLDPQFWLARYVKCQLIRWLPEDFIDFEDLEKSIDSLIKIQEDSEPCPYFILPYLMKSDIYLSSKGVRSAISVIEDGRSKVPLRKINNLSDYFKISLVDFINRLNKSNEIELCNTVKGIGYTLFSKDFIMCE